MKKKISAGTILFVMAMVRHGRKFRIQLMKMFYVVHRRIVRWKHSGLSRRLFFFAQFFSEMALSCNISSDTVVFLWLILLHNTKNSVSLSINLSASLKVNCDWCDLNYISFIPLICIAMEYNWEELRLGIFWVWRRTEFWTLWQRALKWHWIRSGFAYQNSFYP